jgi:hypothetical protein
VLVLLLLLPVIVLPWPDGGRLSLLLLALGVLGTEVTEEKLDELLGCETELEPLK